LAEPLLFWTLCPADFLETSHRSALPIFWLVSLLPVFFAGQGAGRFRLSSGKISSFCLGQYFGLWSGKTSLPELPHELFLRLLLGSFYALTVAGVVERTWRPHSTHTVSKVSPLSPSRRSHFLTTSFFFFRHALYTAYCQGNTHFMRMPHQITQSLRLQVFLGAPLRRRMRPYEHLRAALLCVFCKAL